MLQTADILAGPILRRVEHDLVSVWIALTKPASVEIEVFRGQGVSGSLGPPVGRKNPASALDTDTIAAGQRLHVVVSIWEPASAAGLDLGQIHSYDLVIKTDDGDTARLKDLGLLSDGAATAGDISRLKELGLFSDGSSKPSWLALGYQQGWLPSFAMVPAAVADLKIVQGSCRGSDKPGRDAFPSLDDFLRGVVTDERRRPHMLFLTGDQIYADEAPAEQLDMLLSVSASLLGTQETIPIDFKKTKTEEPATITYPLDATHLPPGRRGHPLLEIAGFTSPNLDSHVMGFGEYCAFYLAGWSDVTWNWNPNALLKARKEPFEAYVRATESIYRRAEDYAAKNPDEDGDALEEMIPYHDAWRLVPAKYRVIDAVLSADDRDALWGKDKAHKEDEKRFFLWKRFWATMPPDDDPIPHQEDESSLPPGTNTKEERNRLARALTPSWFAGVRYFGVPHTPPKKGEDGAPAKLVTKKDMVYNKVHRLDWFYKDLPRVKRLLANIPSYMVFDDHDITDDWNITPRWAKQTRASALGRAVLRNGLAACTLFQSWGNDPRAYRDGIPRRVLELIARLFASPAPAQPGPDPAAAGELERLFDLAPLPAGPPPPRMTWHFRYDGPGFEVIALDSRTWRGFEPEANESIRSRILRRRDRDAPDRRGLAPSDPRAAADRRRAGRGSSAPRASSRAPHRAAPGHQRRRDLLRHRGHAVSGLPHHRVGRAASRQLERDRQGRHPTPAICAMAEDFFAGTRQERPGELGLRAVALRGGARAALDPPDGRLPLGRRSLRLHDPDGLLADGTGLGSRGRSRASSRRRPAPSAPSATIWRRSSRLTSRSSWAASPPRSGAWAGIEAPSALPRPGRRS